MKNISIIIYLLSNMIHGNFYLIRNFYTTNSFIDYIFPQVVNGSRYLVANYNYGR